MLSLRSGPVQMPRFKASFAVLLLLASGASAIRPALAQAPAPASVHQVKGFGVIERVVETGPQPLYEADGYRIRLSPAAVTQFSGKLTKLSDVAAGNWIHYEGKRDAAGELVADRAEFAQGITGEKKPAEIKRESSEPDAVPAHAKLIDANGRFLGPRSKVRMSDAEGQCGWHRLAGDAALQARVWRVGMRIVPEYQMKMPIGAKAQIRFRFYAIDEPKIRSEVACNIGLILVPAQVASRLTTDDQLAAVLADGVAVDLQWQEYWLGPEKYVSLGEATAEVATEFTTPWGLLGIEATTPFVNHELIKHLEEQRGRMALAMMADAGYDPWAAPEAWRLLAPKNPPANSTSLKYPGRSEYQLSILNLEYKKPAHEADTPSR